MNDCDYSGLNNHEYLMVLQIGRRVMKEVLNYRIYASKLQSLIYINSEFL